MGTAAEVRRSETSALDRRVVGPGSVVAELSVSARVSKSALFDGLRAMGFAAVSLAFIEQDGEVTETRFLGKLTRAIVPTDTDRIRWAEAIRVSFDPFAPVAPLQKLALTPFVLKSGSEYEIRFLSRVKKYPRARDVANALSEMGFRIREMIAIRGRGIFSQVAAEEREAYAAWYARGQWTSTMTVTTPEDPFYFCDLRERREPSERSLRKK